MSKIPNLKEVREKTSPIFDRAGVDYAGVFGSFARGEAKSDSDVDILIKFKGRATFDSYIRLEENLRSVLNRDVDLVTEGAVNRFMKPRIESELKLIYGKR